MILHFRKVMNDAITVDVLLATSVENDAVINFELLDNADDILRLENGAVQIKAGEKTARFKGTFNRQSLLNNQRMITLKGKGLYRRTYATME